MNLTTVNSASSRHEWVSAAEFILENYFTHHELWTPRRNPGMPSNRCMELVCRLFLAAGALLRTDPGRRPAGVDPAQVFADAILSGTDPAGPDYWGPPAVDTTASTQPLRQRVPPQLVEGTSLVLGLWLCEEQIWNRFSPREKEQVATYLAILAQSRTNPHNWRFFNVMIAAFLNRHGYPLDRSRMQSHIEHLLAYEAGDGWYRDGSQFDFYSAWAFQFYGPLWCHWYGYAEMPDVAAEFSYRAARFARDFPYFFSRSGHSLMWGRSSIYRCAASAPLVASFFLREPPLAGGFARHIVSGNLQQFLKREEIWRQGIPPIGFYGPFAQMAQSYSSSPSVYWMLKPFVALALPEDSPFWKEPRSEGFWPELGGGQTTRVLPGPGLTVTARGASGSIELRPGKADLRKSDPNYTRLAYHSDHPWEADNPTGATAMAYSVRELDGAPGFHIQTRLRYAGERDGVLYRQCSLPPWQARIDLADIALPDGLLRVDRIRIGFPYELRLGHYALPVASGTLPEARAWEAEGTAKRCVPIVAVTCGGRVLLAAGLLGWDSAAWEQHRELHPEALDSALPYMTRTRNEDAGAPAFCVTLFLVGGDSTEGAFRACDYVSSLEPFGAGLKTQGVELELASGKRYRVDFSGIEGRLQG